MNLATKQRDSVARLAKADWKRALELARGIDDPWFRAQAISHVIRYCDSNPKRLADEASDAAAKCSDHYQQCAVRAWEIAALAERSDAKAASSRLKSALGQCSHVTPCSSRSEAMSLLLHAAVRIDSQAALNVAEEIVRVSNEDSHWRCQRATVDAVGVLTRLDAQSASHLSLSIADPKLKSKCHKMIADGGSPSRDFFW